MQTPKQLRTIFQIVSGCKKNSARKQKATCQMQVTSLFASYKCYRQPGGERRPAAGWAVLEQHFASFASLQDCSPAAGTAHLAASSRQARTDYRTACGFAASRKNIHRLQTMNINITVNVPPMRYDSLEKKPGQEKSLVPSRQQGSQTINL